jgi:ATP-dependent protease ClpP protease subunit
MDFAAASQRARNLWDTYPAVRYAFPDVGALVQTQLAINAEIDEYTSTWSRELTRRCVAGAERLALVRDPAFARAQTNPIERDGSTLTIWLYGPVMLKNANGYHCSAETIVAAVNASKDSNALVVRISSHGGSVDGMKLIRNAITRFRGRSIAIVDHFAISASADIACACDHVVMRANAVLKLHQSTQAIVGTSRTLATAALELQNDDFAFAHHIAAKRHIAWPDLIDLINADRYLSAQEARAAGLCDDITRPLNNSDAVLAHEDFSNAR